MVSNISSAFSRQVPASKPINDYHLNGKLMPAKEWKITFHTGSPGATSGGFNIQITPSVVKNINFTIH